MNLKYFGDSYDLVKRFFCTELSAMGYRVLVEPMFTGDLLGAEQDFFKLIGAMPLPAPANTEQLSALFMDPDTGVHTIGGGRHVSLHKLVKLAQDHALVFAFDQSFSRQAAFPDAMHLKLGVIDQLGAHGMYYNSHARFLFISRTPEALGALRTHLTQIGLPTSRLVTKP